MFVGVSASVQDILKHLRAIDTELFGDGHNALRTERAFRINVHNFSIATFLVGGKLGGDAQSMAQSKKPCDLRRRKRQKTGLVGRLLGLARAEFSKHFRNSHRLNAACV